MMATYADFLARKVRVAESSSLTVDPGDLAVGLHEWQRRIVAWAIHTGRAAIWADTGMGKTFMMCEWAYQIATRTRRPALIVAPLATAEKNPNSRSITQSWSSPTTSDSPTSTPHNSGRSSSTNQCAGCLNDEKETEVK